MTLSLKTMIGAWKTTADQLMIRQTQVGAAELVAALPDAGPRQRARACALAVNS